LGDRTASGTEAIEFAMRSSALMAQDHRLHDSSSAREPIADRRTEHDPAAAISVGPVGLSALGLNAWALSVGFPLLSADVSLQGMLAAASVLGLLGLGALIKARGHPETAQHSARLLLLAAYPAGLAAALALGSEAGRERAHSPFSVVLAALSLLAYFVAALQACRPALPLLPAISRSRRSAHAPAADATRPLQRVAAALLLVGAGAIALVAPLLPEYAEVERSWAEAAGPGAVLSALVGGAIAASIVATQLGSLLKPRRRIAGDGLRQRQNKLASALFLALLGAVVYFTVRS
jgi:hypothetical protein